MRRLSTVVVARRFHALLLVVCGLLCAGGIHAADGWLDLFNGKDLAGWKANADPGAFTVVDGTLKAHATHPRNRGHLFYISTRAEGLEKFTNFELEAVVRGEPDSNSGIFFHTDMETRDGVLHLKNGYEVQLNSSVKEKRKQAASTMWWTSRPVRLTTQNGSPCGYASRGSASRCGSMTRAWWTTPSRRTCSVRPSALAACCARTAAPSHCRRTTITARFTSRASASAACHDAIARRPGAMVTVT
ncbi:MAG: DUF1080 domain-containing protein [Rhodobacteraceae bacterium]|nr:DUF1080 domain-containing protein [Paracoccaceae bacterium]